LPFIARGMATLTVDGPGQGEAEYQFPIRGDYEVPVKAVIDWVCSRKDVDDAAYRLVGCQPRWLLRVPAVAFEKRIRPVSR